jgi:glycerol kinase
LKLFHQAGDSEQLAQFSNLNEPVIFVPGFVGLGAPHWIPDARGVLFGLTRGTTAADLARATLEGVAFQVADLIDAANRDFSTPLQSLRVDGGMAANQWFLQCQADLLGLPVIASSRGEATAWGAASLAGLKAGIWKDRAEWQRLAGNDRTITPRMPQPIREQRLNQWRKAVKAVIGYYKGE